MVDLPAGPLNHHWTKNVIANRDGSKLYATVGSNSNVAEHGMDKEEGRAAIWEIDAKNGSHRIFASGLRNPNGLGWEPASGALWTVVNERDELGSDLVPDYLTSVKDGAFYGWPYSYFGGHVDERVKPPRPDLVVKAVPPDYALGAMWRRSVWRSPKATLCRRASRTACSSASTGRGTAGRLPAIRSSSCRSPAESRPDYRFEVLTGFLSPEGNAYGRPVGVAIDKRGALLVADDVGNVIWRVSSVRGCEPRARSRVASPHRTITERHEIRRDIGRILLGDA